MAASIMTSATLKKRLPLWDA